METMTSPAVRDELNRDALAGRRVHMLMWDAKLSQRALAPRLGMTQANLSKKIRGERGWSIDELFTVARELGTSVSYIIGESENRRPTMKSDGGSEVHPPGIEPGTHWLQDGSAVVIDLPTSRLSDVAPVNDQPADVVDITTVRAAAAKTGTVIA